MPSHNLGSASTPAALQLTRSGIRTRLPAGEIRRLAREFDTSHLVLLRQFLDPTMLRLVQSQVKATRFRVSRHRGFGRDLRMNSSPAVSTLNILMNDRELFGAIDRITRCGRIGSLVGAVRRALPGSGNNLGWHDDHQLQRLVAITINLGSVPYEGGVLQIRDTRSKKIVGEISNTGPGDAVLLRIAPNLEHRNTVVLGGVPKTAFSGWFSRAPDFESQFEEYIAQRKRNSSPRNGGKPARALASVSPDAPVRAPEHIAWRQTEDDCILFNLKSGTCYQLDSIGAEIWNQLAAGRTPRTAARKIAAQYGVPAIQVERDVLSLIAHLRASRLLDAH